uniref:G patch domain-containing protein 4 n=2 Tax=Anas platyrhynchos TaxID=8839 RepID=A0A493TW30_ANAPP
MSAPGPGGRGLSFAEGLLRRHGWSQGKGLGKKEDGISQALRVKVKCDSAGVGHNAAEQFSFHWWDHVFNESAANIAVEDGQDGVCLKTLGEQRSGISTKKPRKAVGAGSKLYGRFVKAATLTARGEEPAKLPAGSESSEEEEEEEKLDRSSARRLTDEELVRACGGRTAHKGARHGLTMSAKLARLEEQERAFLATYQQKREQPQPEELQEKKKKKKKKKKRAGDGAEAEAPQSCEPSGDEEVEGEEEKVAKRKKKKKKEKEELAEAELPLEEAEGAEQAEHSPKKKKKRKKKRREEE